MSIIIIAVIVVILICILIVWFARKASQTKSTPTSTRSTSSGGVSSTSPAKVPLTAEQSSSLKKAQSQLTSIRMTLSRITDQNIAQSGNEAIASIDKVLQALREKPEKIQTTRQLFNYYIPTMERVVSKYQRIEASGVDNPEMPEKLMNYLGDIKEGMATLYEGLYDNDKLNVDVDMEAMTIAIKRDGLLDDEDFNLDQSAPASPIFEELKSSPLDEVSQTAQQPQAAEESVEETMEEVAEEAVEKAEEAAEEVSEEIDTAKAAIEPAEEAITEAVEEAAEETIPEAAEEAVEEVVPEPAEEASAKPKIELVLEPVFEPEAKAAAETAAEPATSSKIELKLEPEVEVTEEGELMTSAPPIE